MDLPEMVSTISSPLRSFPGFECSVTAESRVDAPLASLSLTYIRRGYRLMPHIGSFCEERRRGLTYVSHATGQTHRGRKILHLEANLSNPRGCVCNPSLRKKMPPMVSKSAPLISLRG